MSLNVEIVNAKNVKNDGINKRRGIPSTNGHILHLQSYSWSLLRPIVLRDETKHLEEMEKNNNKNWRNERKMNGRQR